MNGDLEIEVKEEKLLLLPERAAFWQQQSTLLVADPHWGKAATFRVSGIPVPAGTTNDAIARLDSMLARTHAQRICFLGDLLHAREGRSQGMFDSLRAWRDQHRELDVMLVRGNHDKRAGDPPGELRFDCVDAPFEASPFVLAHHPARSENGYVISGHVHPAVRLYGRGGMRERLACFWFGRDYGVLPAFGDFTGLGDVEAGECDSVYAVAGDAVVPVSSF